VYAVLMAGDGEFTGFKVALSLRSHLHCAGGPACDPEAGHMRPALEG
jgi:hypothetical protein